MRPWGASGVAVGAACVLAAGCGSSPTQQVRAKVQQFAVAVAHRDAKTICTEVFAPSLVKRFASAGLSCRRGLEIFFSGVQHPTLAVGSVAVHGSRASVMTLSGASGQIASLRPVVLLKTSGGWRIAALGAPVQGGGTPPGATTTTGSTTTTKRAHSTTSGRAPTTTKKTTPPNHPAAKKGSTSTKP
jgi:hypothetical protein